MKRIFTILFAATLAGQAWAQTTFIIDDLEYTVIEGTTNVSVCSSGEKLPANLVIPSEVEDGGMSYVVTTIADQAFNWCSELKLVTIPSTITTIGNNIFKSCAYITEIIVDGGNTAFSSENGVLFNKDKTVLIYYPSNKTGAYTIPNSVTTIGDGAFKYCKNLTAVTIQNSVVSIGASAFEGCDKLTSVSIPNSVTSIGEAAFKSCYDLATITLSNAITRISNELFSGCAFTSIEIPNGVTRIGSYAFLATDLTSLIIPNTVITIEERAFERSSDLETVVIPKSVDSIGVAAFTGNSKLTIYCEAESQPSGWDDYWNWDDRPVEWGYDPNAKMWKVTVSANNDEYGSVSGGGTYANGSTVTITATPADGYKFVKWSNGLTNTTETITVTSDTTLVAEFADGHISHNGLYYLVTSDSTVEVAESYDYRNLTSVTIPDTIMFDGKSYSVTSIGNSVFEGCSNLTSVTMPNSVKSIGDRTFYECEKLASVTIPEQVTTIGVSAFYDCDELTSITIPKSVSYILIWAFDECDKLKEIKVDSSNMYYSSENGVLFNKDKTKLIRFPGGVTGAYTIPDGVTNIGFSAFNSCRELTSIIIPNTVVNIENYAFDNTGITSVIIPNSVTTIGDDAFEYCSYLTSVVIPNSVTSIGYDAFFGCHSATIYCESNEKPTGWSNNWNYNWSGNVPVVWGFDPSMKIFNITLSVNNVWHGSVEGPRTASEGSTVTITATPEEGFHFVKWSNGLTNATETITVTSDTTLVAEFAEDKTWIVTLLANNTEYGTVTKISGSNLDGSTYSAAATPNPGYKFVKWSNGLTTDTISITLTSDTTLRAEFAEIVYTGTCGDDARWSFSVASKTLTISGTGSIDKYKTVDLFSTEVNRPWQEVADQIEKVVIGEGITNLGRNAFSYCNNLKEANISSTCDSYGSMSFADCPNLKKMVVAANSVNQANEYCFSNYDSCTVYVPADRVDYYKKDIIFGMFKNIVGGYLVTIDADIKCGTVEVESYIVPEGGKVTITPKPNDGYIVTDVTFKDDRGYYAFTTYTNGYQYWIENNAGSNIIVKVEFSRKGDSGFIYKVISGTNIEITKYKGTDSVITIPSTITDNGVEYTVTSIGDRAFDGNSDVKSVTIPNTVTNIGESAFSYPDLTSLTVPNSVKTIGEYAFSDVKNVVYNGSASGSPWGALTINGIVDGKCIFADAEKTHLTAYITSRDSMETTINIPESVITIGENAFTNVWAKKIDGAYYWGNEENPYLILWHVGDYSIDSVITSYEIKDGCKYIYYTAFANMQDLESVTIPNSVISIGKLAFFGCDNLKSVNIPDGVVAIGEGAFSNCYGLSSITIPKSVTTIDKYAFGDCDNLTITCEVSSKPEGWDNEWNSPSSTVNWAEIDVAVAESAANAASIYAHGNTIVVENATDEISVYDAMGCLVCRNAARHVSTVAESGIRAELQVNITGVYIVKVGTVVKRVMINN